MGWNFSHLCVSKSKGSSSQYVVPGIPAGKVLPLRFASTCLPPSCMLHPCISMKAGTLMLISAVSPVSTSDLSPSGSFCVKFQMLSLFHIKVIPRRQELEEAKCRTTKKSAIPWQPFQSQVDFSKGSAGGQSLLSVRRHISHKST